MNRVTFVRLAGLGALLYAAATAPDPGGVDPDGESETRRQPRPVPGHRDSGRTDIGTELA